MAGNQLFAAIDMGTNSFKLLIVTDRFIPILRINSSVALSSSAISPILAISALRHFHTLLTSHDILPSLTRHVATSAIRQANNQSSFINTLHENMGHGFKIEVLSGEDEARLTYLGVICYHPSYNTKRVLIIDIGGGSTEFVVGIGGLVLLGVSLLLGHVTLTREYVESGRIDEMREHIRGVVRRSGLVQEVEKHGFEVVVGSSGTIRAIEKAVYNGYGKELKELKEMGDLNFVYKRDWKFSRRDLNDLVKKLCLEDRETEKEEAFKKRAEFIVAGAVLLEEIFGMLGINKVEVSRYSLCEGVIAERLAGSLDNDDLKVNARWRSVICLASRFNSMKKMKNAALCAALAKEMFESVRKWNKLGISFDECDIEYLEAACLLHNVGVVTGKKGYHKQSYRIIMNDGHLHGYDLDEIKIVALLCRYHRKKFPKLGHHSLEGFTKEFKQKFRVLCAILRVSIVLQRFVPVNIKDVKVLHSEEGFNLVLGTQILAEDNADSEIGEELEIFYSVLHQKLTVLIPSADNATSRYTNLDRKSEKSRGEELEERVHRIPQVITERAW